MSYESFFKILDRTTKILQMKSLNIFANLNKFEKINLKFYVKFMKNIKILYY